jgi:hypothetical protein
MARVAALTPVRPMSTSAVEMTWAIVISAMTSG